VKPQYIFSAVITICLMMAALLPQVAQTQSAPPLAAAAQESLPSVQAALGPVVDGVVVNQQAAATPVVVEQENIEPPLTQELPPAEAPVEPPVFVEPESGVRPDTSAAIPVTADLEAFAASVKNNQASQVVGVYADGVFSLPVREQPGGDESYVSSENNTVTRYNTPERYGVIALLAHNYLSGRAFFKLRQNQEIVIVYGDGRLARFRISSIQNFQAISPNDVRSDFRDLNIPNGGLLTYSQLFSRVYTNSGTLVFQTCIEVNGEYSWGRMFIIANPN
jgi:hypothetical protein